MSRRFESADPLRRGPRRPTAAALRAAAQRAAQARTSNDRQAGPVPHLRPAALKPGGAEPAPAGAAASPAPGEPAPMQEFALKMCTDEDLRDARYHILKFHSTGTVDPAQDFVPPVRMHRKDPKQLQVLASDEDPDSMEAEVKAEPGDGDGGPGAEPAGAEANGGGAGDKAEEARPKRRPFNRKRKTHQAYGGEKNDAARKLRYEEHYPWVMEDFDNKNTWVSSYEAAQSNNYAILTYDAASNGFKVIPIEKVYRMTAATRHATLSLEDAEKKMESKHTMRDRWMMAHLQPRAGAGPGDGPGEPGPGMPARLRTVVGSEERKHKYTLDEEMDFDDQQLFDDDEGAPLLDGPEEELKEAEDRIKQEQLKANELMDASEDGEMDDLFNDDGSKEGKQGRKMRKALRSLEKNQYYDTDDENNPYASSESDDSEAELATAMVKQEEEDAAGGGDGAAAPGGGGDPATAEAAAAEAAASSLLVSQFRRRAINRDLLPRGTVVLQLPPAALARFARGEWNPAARRAASDEPADADPTLLTRDHVRRNIRSGETDLKQLLAALRPKLAENPENRRLLRTYIKEVARHRDGKLILRN